MANVGTDVERAIKWKQKGDMELSRGAFERALELLTFTILDPKNRTRLKELCRVREFLIDHFLCNNDYQTTDEYWQSYFYDFAYAAAIERGL